MFNDTRCRELTREENAVVVWWIRNEPFWPFVKAIWKGRIWKRKIFPAGTPAEYKEKV